MIAEKVVSYIQSKGVVLSRRGENIYFTPKSKLIEADIEQLRRHKQAILAILDARKNTIEIRGGEEYVFEVSISGAIDDLILLVAPEGLTAEISSGNTIQVKWTPPCAEVGNVFPVKILIKTASGSSERIWNLRIVDCGAGTELKRLLGKLGFTANNECNCSAHAREMDTRGPDWCEANIETIVGWLRDEAHKRDLPFVPLIARALVRRAIKNARQ